MPDSLPLLVSKPRRCPSYLRNSDSTKYTAEINLNSSFKSFKSESFFSTTTNVDARRGVPISAWFRGILSWKDLWKWMEKLQIISTKSSAQAQFDAVCASTWITCSILFHPFPWIACITSILYHVPYHCHVWPKSSLHGWHPQPPIVAEHLPTATVPNSGSREQIRIGPVLNQSQLLELAAPHKYVLRFACAWYKDTIFRFRTWLPTLSSKHAVGAVSVLWGSKPQVLMLWCVDDFSWVLQVQRYAMLATFIPSHSHVKHT